MQTKIVILFAPTLHPRCNLIYLLIGVCAADRRSHKATNLGQEVCKKSNLITILILLFFVQFETDAKVQFEFSNKTFFGSSCCATRKSLA
jgi:hypothetical protein